MSDLILTYTHRSDGVLADVTSVILSNADGTIGVERDDTGEVVVADNTEMTRTATGVYQFIVEDAEPGVSYTAYFEIHNLDVVTRIERASRAPYSYLTLDRAREIAPTLPDLPAAFMSASDFVIAAGLPIATRRIDSSRPYQGAKYLSTQVLQFPRIVGNAKVDWYDDTNKVGAIWDYDQSTQEAIVPPNVELACLYELASMIDGSRNSAADAAHNGIASQSAASFSVSYRQDVGSNGLPMLCRQADQLLTQYQLHSGVML